MPAATGIAPHLRRLMADYAATGLPPAYVPKHEPTTSLTDLGDGDDGSDDLDQDLR